MGNGSCVSHKSPSRAGNIQRNASIVDIWSGYIPTVRVSRARTILNHSNGSNGFCRIATASKIEVLPELFAPTSRLIRLRRSSRTLRRPRNALMKSASIASGAFLGFLGGRVSSTKVLPSRCGSTNHPALRNVPRGPRSGNGSITSPKPDLAASYLQAATSPKSKKTDTSKFSDFRSPPFNHHASFSGRVARVDAKCGKSAQS